MLHQEGRMTSIRAVVLGTLVSMLLATPAVANGSVIIRTASKLYRIGQTK